MHQLVPNFILSQYSTGERGGQFKAIGMFVDISGFSSMTDALMAHGQHGAEVLANIMQAVLDPIMECVYEQGGFVTNSAGDALTALFPIEEGHRGVNSSGHLSEGFRDAPLRALAAAVCTQKSREKNITFDTPYHAFRISTKVGLAMGEARWGIITNETGNRCIYYFQGTAVDGCAEAEHQANAGDVILDLEVLDRLRGKVEVDPVGEYFRLLEVQCELPSPQPFQLPAFDLDSMALFFPRELITQESSGEFRLALNMFINLPSVRTETQLQIFMESLFTLQEKYGGLLSRLDFGDKGTNILMFWGAPVAYENDIKRALSFILMLQTITSISISAGVTYRISHAGFIGGRLFEEFTCFGRGINLAARFMTSAPRGEIWVDEAIARRAGKTFEIEFVDERPFKGFTQPQKVYALLEAREEKSETFTVAMIGRESEIESLNEFIQPLFSGQCAGLLVVSGEPGIGKSRLVSEFLYGLGGRMQVFLAQSDEILRQSMNPWKYWLRHYFAITEAQGEARIKRGFNRKLDDLIAATGNHTLAEELDRTRSCLGALVDLHWPDSLFEQLDAEGRFNNTFIALASLLQAEGLRAPVVVLLEDIHSQDNDSRSFLIHLLRLLSTQGGSSVPIAIVATTRGSAAGLELEGVVFQELCLQGLNRQSLERMAAGQLLAPPTGILLDLLEERAEGNPFYAEQMLHYLKEENLLRREPGGWSISQEKVDYLPEDVNALLVARLDRLAQNVRDVVQTASVLGREFEVRLLSRMLHGKDLFSRPVELEIAEREAIWFPLNEIRYAFKHILMRDAAYQMQIRTRREALHALALEACENLYESTVADHYGELGYHAEQAGLEEKASQYLRQAGMVAQAMYQIPLAVDYFSRALNLTAFEKIEERCRLLLDLGKAYRNRGDYQANRLVNLQFLDEVKQLVSDEGLRIDIELCWGWYWYDMGKYDQGEQVAKGVLDRTLAAGMLEKASNSYQLLANLALNRGNLRLAENHARRCVEHVLQVGLSEEAYWALNILGMVVFEQGNLDEASECFTQCMEFALKERKKYLLVPALNNLGRIANSRGDYLGALNNYEQALSLARQLGMRDSEAITLGNVGFIYGLTGQYQKARAAIERAIQLTREEGNSYIETYHLINLSRFAGSMGELETAVRYAQEALALARQIGDRSAEAWALTYLGHSLQASENSSAASDAYLSAQAIRQELNQPDLASEPAVGLARCALDCGDVAAAYNHLGPVLNHLKNGGGLEGADDSLRVYLTLYTVLRQVGDQAATDWLALAHKQLQDRAAGIVDEDSRRAFLENIDQHREIEAAWQVEQRDFLAGAD